MSVQLLPKLVHTVAVPEMLAVTQVARAVDCRLAGVLPSALAAEERLPPDPRAVLGTIFHRVVQDSRRGRVGGRSDGNVREALADHLNHLISTREAELATGRLAHYVPLRDTLTFADYLDRSTRAIVRALEVYRPPAEVDQTFGARKPLAIEGVEVGLQSDALNLTGSLDACNELTDEVHVRDLKTGNVRDAHGVAPHVSLQLGLYALMVQEVRPRKRVRLFVDHSSTDELPWGPKEEAATRDALAAVRADLKPGPASTTALAKPGAACRWCDVRHVCPAYREQASSWWSLPGLDFVPPSDIAGVIDALPVITGEVAALRLRDLSKRRVSVVGVTPRHGAFAELQPGRSVWMFAFAPRGSIRNADRLYSHPTNFREAVLAQGDRRAYSAILYSAELA